MKCTFVPQITHLKVNDNASVDTSATTPVFERLHESKQFMQKILSQVHRNTKSQTPLLLQLPTPYCLSYFFLTFVLKMECRH